MVQNPSLYLDPLDQIWISVATEFGLTLMRDASTYASTNGNGLLTIATTDCLDSDDCLAQMILHEVCHGLTEGEASFGKADWGLPNMPDQVNESTKIREHACLRLQAALTRPYGLDQLLAPTTEFRAYYDQLPENPIQSLSLVQDPACMIAQEALQLARKAPYHQILRKALSKTASIHQMMKNLSFPSSKIPSIWKTAPPPLLHPSLFPFSKENKEHTCQTCAWFQQQKGECSKSKVFFESNPKISKHSSACVMYEKSLDCQSCAACCRDFFELVPIRKTDTILKKAPFLIQKQDNRFFMRREHKKCVALEHLNSQSHHCSIYQDRPQTCQDFTQGSQACLLARQKTGISL